MQEAAKLHQIEEVKNSHDILSVAGIDSYSNSPRLRDKRPPLPSSQIELANNSDGEESFRTKGVTLQAPWKTQDQRR